jgi:hypothetical protein
MHGQMSIKKNTILTHSCETLLFFILKIPHVMPVMFVKDESENPASNVNLLILDTTDPTVYSFQPHSVALGCTQPLTEMSIKKFLWDEVTTAPSWLCRKSEVGSPTFHPPRAFMTYYGTTNNNRP